MFDSVPFYLLPNADIWIHVSSICAVAPLDALRLSWRNVSTLTF
jgi:hypothetical protein